MLRYGTCLSGRRAKAGDEALHAIWRYGLMPVCIGEVAIVFDRGFIGGLEGCAVLGFNALKLAAFPLAVGAIGHSGAVEGVRTDALRRPSYDKLGK